MVVEVGQMRAHLRRAQREADREREGDPENGVTMPSSGRRGRHFLAHNSTSCMDQ